MGGGTGGGGRGSVKSPDDSTTPLGTWGAATATVSDWIKRRRAASNSAICSWTSGDWFTTRALPSGKKSIVALPPTLLQLSGLIVLVIRSISRFSSFSLDSGTR